MRSAAKMIFLGPITRSNGDKKGHTFSTLQADGGLIQLEYPSRKAAVTARRALSKTDHAMIVGQAILFDAIIMAINEAKALASRKSKPVQGRPVHDE
jgi:hypothetical protein